MAVSVLRTSEGGNHRYPQPMWIGILSSFHLALLSHSPDSYLSISSFPLSTITFSIISLSSGRLPFRRLSSSQTLHFHYISSARSASVIGSSPNCEARGLLNPSLQDIGGRSHGTPSFLLLPLFFSSLIPYFPSYRGRCRRRSI